LPNYAIIRKWELLEQVDDEKIIKQREQMMQHTLPSEDIRPLSLFGSQATELLRAVQMNRRPVFLINKGKAAGALMDIEEYERLLELIDFHKTILASERNTENKVAV
jgi:PHD/YefM family antitoxin component YafN of YafNO toxin-antitoxin module